MSSQCRARKRPHRQVSPAYPALGSPSSHGRPGSSAQIDGSLKGSESLTKGKDARSWTWNKRTGQNRRRMTIDILPDDVLLGIFGFLVVESIEFEAETWWRRLVHVCQKWRNVIFGSPHRLNLRLVCSARTPLWKMLDVWPPFPIIAIHDFASSWWGGDNIVAALKRNDRVCQIEVKLDRQWKKVLDAMQEPFPVLTHLILLSDIEIAQVVPDSFMGGSAPRLQYLLLDHISIPGLPKLLSSSTDLVRLDLRHIPHSGYISPEAIVTCVSTLPRLERLYLGFDSPRSHPNLKRRRLPSPTRSVLPALIKLHFTGVSEYLEDLVARINTPLLHCLEIALFHQLIFDTPQLIQFISRTPTLEVNDRAHLYFSDLHVGVRFSKPSSNYHLTLQVSCRQPEWQLSSMAQIGTSFFPLSFIYMAEILVIRESHDSRLLWHNIENSQWLELLQPFTAVKDLYLSKEFAPRIMSSLGDLVGGRTAEVLPALRNLFLEELHPSRSFWESIKKFDSARQLSGHPVAIKIAMW